MQLLMLMPDAGVVVGVVVVYTGNTKDFSVPVQRDVNNISTYDKVVKAL